ncbi:MAG: acetyltransferase [Nitrospirales bacterium]|nr:MAG: acetyltransferase [Nitrospirales bacterium]
MKNEGQIEIVSDVTIRQATGSDAYAIALMVHELLQEVMRETNVPSFDVNVDLMHTQARQYIESRRYVVFLAIFEGREEPLGLLSVCECCALYAGGAFGMIPECYVRTTFRSKGVGGKLIAAVKDYGKEKNWRRLEVTTPPLPTFQRTFRFYQQVGFDVSGGRKLKVSL